MSPAQPAFCVDKSEWITVHALLKLAATPTPRMDWALTALIEGKAEVRERWSIAYKWAKERGIDMDFPPFTIPVSGKEWQTARTLLRQAGKLTPNLDICLTGLSEGQAEVRVVVSKVEIPKAHDDDDDIPF